MRLLVHMLNDTSLDTQKEALNAKRKQINVCLNKYEC